ncbi:Gti1/Pac2 family-domain-containing protein [Syncephalis fuscata]|nr:Gti1/Pac2 family-domain-containing protein [Syncephalis fuscata]
METYNGYMETALDALLLLEGCRTNVLKFVTKRLDEVERTNIHSGQIFVWDEKPLVFNDGLMVVVGHRLGLVAILLSIENCQQKSSSSSSPSSPESTDDISHQTDTSMLAATPSNNSSNNTNNNNLLGPGVLTSAGIRVPAKPNGLIKRALSITISDGRRYHLVSYYMSKDLEAGCLSVPRFDDRLRNLQLAEGVYPALTREVGQDGVEAWRFATSQGRGHASALSSDILSTGTTIHAGTHHTGNGSPLNSHATGIASTNESTVGGTSSVNCFRIQPNCISPYASAATHGISSAAPHAPDHFYQRRYSLQYQNPQQQRPQQTQQVQPAYNQFAPTDRAVCSRSSAGPLPPMPASRLLSRTVSTSSIPDRHGRSRAPSSIQLPSLSTLLAGNELDRNASYPMQRKHSMQEGSYSEHYLSHANDTVNTSTMTTAITTAVAASPDSHSISSSPYESNRYPRPYPVPASPLSNSTASHWTNESSPMETECIDCQVQPNHLVDKEHAYKDHQHHQHQQQHALQAMTTVNYLTPGNGNNRMMDHAPSSLRFYRPRSASTPHLFHTALRRKSSLSIPHPGYFHMGHGSGQQQPAHSPHSPHSPHSFSPSSPGHRSPLYGNTLDNGVNEHSNMHHAPISPIEHPQRAPGTPTDANSNGYSLSPLQRCIGTPVPLVDPILIGWPLHLPLMAHQKEMAIYAVKSGQRQMAITSIAMAIIAVVIVRLHPYFLQ